MEWWYGVFTSGHGRGRGETGFKSDEIFRKYLRWCLDQRPFDPATVNDLLNLSKCCVLTDDQVRLQPYQAFFRSWP